jgi:hypothetical protein
MAFKIKSMHIKEVYNEKFNTKEQIINATLSKPNELVFMDSKADVFRYNFETKEQTYLFSPMVNTNFDPKEKSTIYTLDEIVIVVNDFKLDGSIHYPNKYKFLTFCREDYHASISKYPISLFKNKDGVPHLIYAQAWNHIQIINLDTRQILTATKSLIDVRAVVRRIEIYKNHNESNKLKWPSPYDYFFGELKLSPNQKYFLSAGWAWGSCDAYNVYNIDEFIKSNRISDIQVTAGEHETRATCWVDNEIIAVSFHPLTEGEESQKDLYEIHLFKINDEEFTLTEKIKVIGIDIVNTKMYYNTNFDAFVFIKTQGFYVISREGELLYSNKNLKVEEYNKNCFVSIKENLITVFELLD